MSTNALIQGGPSSIEMLPPTLQPNAILAMAPPLERRTSFLASCLVYAACAGLLVVGSKVKMQDRMDAVHTTGGGAVIVVLDPVKAKPVETPPLPPPPQPRGFVPEKLARTDLPPAVAPPDAVPDTPNVLLSTNLSTTGVPVSQNPLTHVPGSSMGTPVAQSSQITQGQVMEIDFTNVRILHQVSPNYPALAKAIRLQGAVELMMTINEKGVPAQVQVLSGPPQLHGEAVRAAMLWRFEPARLNGTPMSARFRLTLKFTLK